MIPSPHDGPTLVEDEWHEEAETLHLRAEALALTKLDHLLSWAANVTDAPKLMDFVITELGIPEPDHHPSGAPIPGSITRKILYHAHVEGLVREQRARLNAERRSLSVVKG